MAKASGTFVVTVTPQAPDEGDTSGIGRLTLDKEFQGELAATSKGQMLAMSTAVEGSAGYVAMEQVTGSLQGKNGSFSLQHFGKMTRGAPELSVAVVPDSGTGELTGLSGKMQIIIAEGKHSYEFEYELGS
ncbi:MAG TPA: DUF3224 domain-containing protein [Pyrinomonadaceae bacterium]|nr:DUF3224 domain-containing protein [Pyrinomonadaceae bacterium]